MSIAKIALCLSAVTAASVSSAADLSRPLASAVKIYGAGGLRGLPAYATGLLLTDGHVVTARSHVLDADPVLVVLDDGRRFDASVLGQVERHGLSVLRLDEGDAVGGGYDVREFAPPPPPGTPLWATGNMFRIAAGDEAVSVQRVTASFVGPVAVRRGRYDAALPDPVLVLDAVTNNPGAGGGPVFDAAGRPVALIGRELRHDETGTWVNYAVPLGPAAYEIKQIIETDGEEASAPDVPDPDRPSGLTPGDYGLALLPDVVRRTPAFVASVAPDSPASRAGLRTDDLIVAVAGRTTVSVREVLEAFGASDPTRPVTVSARRGERLVTVTLEPPE